MSQKLRIIFFLLISMFVSFVYAADQDQRIWNLKDIDIRTLVKQVSEETGKNLVVDPRVKGKVTMYSNKALSPDELYQTFLSILEVHGYAAIPSGKVVKIVPLTEAKGSGTKVLSVPSMASGAQQVVRVIHADYVPVKKLLTALKALIPRSSHISFYEPSNDMIVAATAENVSKIEEIVARLDKPSEGGTELIRLKYAVASDVASTLEGMEKLQKNTSRPIVITYDERTNSLLLSGGRSRRLRLRTIIAQLDSAGSSTGNTRVMYLKYIRAADIAPILANMIEGYKAETSSGSQNRRSKTSVPRRPSGVRNPLGNTLTSTSRVRGGRSTSSSSLLDQFGQAGNFNLPDDDRQRSGSAGPSVQWEETTNSVIVKAPPGILRSVRNVIAKLDIRRPQVLVEVIVAEVTVRRARELGVEWNGAGDVALNTRFPSAALTNIASGFRGAGDATTLGNGMTIGFFNNGNLRAIVRALASDVSTNILATPNIVTLDNEAAAIKVGQLVPFAVGTSTDTTSQGGTPFTSFEREEVGLSLTIRPQITHSGAIRMYIQNILSSIIPGTQETNPGNNATTSERVISTNVMVDNGQVLVLGGLIQSNWTETVNKVPLLGDLPGGLGLAFRSTAKTLEKTNLMIFIKPIILRDTATGIQVTNGKYSQIRAKQIDSTRELARPFRSETPTLPPLDGPQKIPQPFPLMQPQPRMTVYGQRGHALPPAEMQGPARKSARQQRRLPHPMSMSRSSRKHRRGRA